MTTIMRVSGFPGYFVFLVVGALGPSSALFSSAVPVVNWRAFSLVLFVILLTSLLWEATLGVPYGWWGYQPGADDGDLCYGVELPSD